MADHNDVRFEGGSLEVVPTLVRDPQPVEFERLLEQRRRLGQDLLDEVWEGVYHMNPAQHSRHSYIQQQLAVLLDQPARQAALRPRLGIFNLGEPDDYRIPDGGLLRPGEEAVYLPAAALVVEIVSPDDKTWDKLGFYASRGGSPRAHRRPRGPAACSHRRSRPLGGARDPCATDQGHRQP